MAFLRYTQGYEYHAFLIDKRNRNEDFSPKLIKVNNVWVEETKPNKFCEGSDLVYLLRFCTTLEVRRMITKAPYTYCCDYNEKMNHFDIEFGDEYKIIRVYWKEIEEG